MARRFLGPAALAAGAMDGDGVDNYVDWPENSKKTNAREAAVSANPGGTFSCSIWNQWQEDNKGNIFDSNTIFRRVTYLDEEPTTPPSEGGGGGKKDKPDKDK